MSTQRGFGAMNAAEERRAKEMATKQAASEQDMQKMAEQRQQQQEMEEKKRVMVRSLLEPEALERLNRLGMVKPEKQQHIEAMLLHLAQSGQIQEKVGDAGLVQIIEKVDASRPSTSSVKFQRKRRGDDDEDDIDLDNL